MEVSPDIGAPVTEQSQWTQKEKAFDPLVEDEEKLDIQRQAEAEEPMVYVSGTWLYVGCKVRTPPLLR